MKTTIEKAAEYLNIHGITEESINDACNLFSSSYEEYMSLWHELENLL